MRHVILIIDESGSMWSQRGKVIQGINSFMNQLYSTGDPDLYFSLVFFHDTYRYIIRRECISQLTPLSINIYTPCNCTALYDTVYGVLTDFEQSWEEHIVYIITDGADTMSKKISRDKMNKTILDFKNTGRWKFILCDTDINRLNTQEIPTIQYDVNCVDDLIGQLTQMSV